MNQSYCDQLTDRDIASLGSVSKLNLSECTQITDVSNLGKVKEPNHSDCIGITRGMHCFGGVQDLNLSDCDQLTDEDIASLGSVSKLNLP